MDYLNLVLDLAWRRGDHEEDVSGRLVAVDDFVLSL